MLLHVVFLMAGAYMFCGCVFFKFFAAVAFAQRDPPVAGRSVVYLEVGVIKAVFNMFGFGKAFDQFAAPSSYYFVVIIATRLT